MCDKEIIDLAAELFNQLGIGFSRHDKASPKGGRHVWIISVNARGDLIRLAECVPIQHRGKRERLVAILGSYLTAKVYARRSDHMVFVKGDPKRATQALGPVDVSAALAEIEPDED